MIVQYKSVIIFCFIITTTDASSNRNFSQRCICWLQTKWRLKVRRFFMKIWAFDPKNCQKYCFWRLLAKMWTFCGSLGSSLSPYVIAKVHWEKKISIQKTVDISLYIDAARSECCTQAAMDPTHDDYSPSGTYGQSSIWNIPIYFFLKHPICSNAIQK